MKNTISSITAFIKSQPVYLRWLVAVLAIVAIGVFAMDSYSTSNPQYSPLFGNLTASSAASVTQALQKAGVPYQTTQTGNTYTVMVPSSEVVPMRINLAGQNLPNGGNPFSLFSSPALGQTQFDQQVNYQAAVQEELQNTIDGINGINSSQVNLSIPNQSPFVSTQQPTTASVLVSLEPGVLLSQEQIQAIVNLVAGSVPGLSAKNISVVDNYGNILSGQGASQSQASNPTQENLDVQLKYSQQIQSEIQNFLSTLSFKSSVAVHVAINFQNLSEQITTYGNSVVAQSSTTTNNSTSTTPAGVPGNSSNTGTATGTTYTAGAPTTTTSTASTANTTYDVNKTVEFLTQHPSIARVTVAVFINQPLSPTQMANLKSGIANAAGLNLTTGDSIVVAQMPFYVAPAKPVPKPVAPASNLPFILELVGGGLLLILIIFLAFRRKPKYEEAPAPTIDPQTKERVAQTFGQRIKERPEDIAKVIRVNMRKDEA